MPLSLIARLVVCSEASRLPSLPSTYPFLRLPTFGGGCGGLPSAEATAPAAVAVVDEAVAPGLGRRGKMPSRSITSYHGVPFANDLIPSAEKPEVADGIARRERYAAVVQLLP